MYDNIKGLQKTFKYLKHERRGYLKYLLQIGPQHCKVGLMISYKGCRNKQSGGNGVEK